MSELIKNNLKDNLEYNFKEDLRNDDFLRALQGKPVSRVPIWVMRQAGRYLPEYRKLRSGVKDFLELCKTPQLAAEVTMQPLDRFDLDASIMFSDILVIPEAMGMDLQFVSGVGPVFKNPITNLAQVEQLKIIDPKQDLDYVLETIDLIKTRIAGKIPLIGFSGSPWTLAAYMIEGAGSKQFALAKQMLYAQPEVMTALLEKLTDAVIAYFDAQIQAGVNALMLFDTWGGLLDPVRYENFSLIWMKKIINKLREKYNNQIPIVMFTKGGGLYLPQQVSALPNGVGLDWTVDLGVAIEQIDQYKSKFDPANKFAPIAVQGNLDPCTLFADDVTIRQQVERIFNQVAQQRPDFRSFVFNLGHGILPPTQPEKLAYLVDLVHKYKI